MYLDRKSRHIMLRKHVQLVHSIDDVCMQSKGEGFGWGGGLYERAKTPILSLLNVEIR